MSQFTRSLALSSRRSSGSGGGRLAMRGRGGRSPRRGAGLAPLVFDAEGQLDGFDSLPHMPAVLGKVQQALRSQHADAKEIAQLVSTDVGLTAQILRVVNSAYYGLARQILDLRYAIAYLGFQEVTRVVLTVSVVGGLEVKDKRLLKRFWHHSFHTSLVARYLSELYERTIDPGELAPAALLHDIGVLVYCKLYPDNWRAIEQHRNAQRCLLFEAEEAVGQPSHGALGALLARRWQLPEVVEDICQHHEHERPLAQPGTPRMRAFRRVVAAAANMCEVSSGSLDPPSAEVASARAQALLGVDSDDFMTLMATVYELKDQADEFTRGVV